MAIIKCRLAEDGTLAPSAVEFEPGDAIRFESDKPVHVLAGSSVAIQALGSFALNEVAVQKDGGSILINIPDLQGQRLPPGLRPGTRLRDPDNKIPVPPTGVPTTGGILTIQIAGD
jgi:hypothetical protein